MDNKCDILVVDDDEGQCKTLSFILKRNNYRVETVNSGLEAIQLSERRLFDIIFMDIKMTPIDGVEAFRRIRIKRADSIVVFITAYADEERIQEALHEGAYGVLMKPLDMDKLLQMIQEVMDSRENP